MNISDYFGQPRVNHERKYVRLCGSGTQCEVFLFSNFFSTNSSHQISLRDLRVPCVSVVKNRRREITTEGTENRAVAQRSPVSWTALHSSKEGLS
jgi:hypothetical protein